MRRKTDRKRASIFFQVFVFLGLITAGLIFFFFFAPPFSIERILFLSTVIVFIFNINLSYFFIKHTQEMKIQSETLNSNLGSIVSASNNIEKQMTHLFQAHTKELRQSVEKQFEVLNLNLGSIVSASNNIEKQMTHLFQAHTKELRQSVEKQFEALNIGLNKMYLEKVMGALKTLERDLIILSDIMEKNTKLYLKHKE